MSCHHNKDCDCHQNSSFIFGLIIGLIIAAVVAVVIYRNNRQDVFVKLKKQIEKFLSSFKKSATLENISSLAKKVNINNSAKISKKVRRKKSKKVSTIKIVVPQLHKKEVTIPDNLVTADTVLKPSISKPKKMFKK